MADMRSEAQQRASRENGAKGRGPVTAEGKARALGHRLSHGLRARDAIVIPGEDAAEYARHRGARLIEHYQPQGPVEAWLTDRIAADMWRLGRCSRIEAGVLRSRIDAERIMVAFDAEHRDGSLLGRAFAADTGDTASLAVLGAHEDRPWGRMLSAVRELERLQAKRPAALPLEPVPVERG